jgi:hypothetical protein
MTTTTGSANLIRASTVTSFVLAAVALLFFPIVGVAAIALAVVGYHIDERELGRWAIAVAVGSTVVGFGLVLLSNV